MPRRTKHYGNCPYCGEYDKLTKDHVIPECLFPETEPLPGDIPKIYACGDCNNKKKSGNDEYLRDLLSTDMHTSRSPIVQQIMPKFHRAVKRNQSILARDILHNSQLVELRTPAGLYGGQAYTIPTANDKTLEIMTMYVRGLYELYLHKILPLDIESHFTRAGVSAEINDMMQYLNRNGGIYARISDGNVFECLFGHAHDVPEAGIWILNFMRRAVFVVIVTPKNLSQQPIEHSTFDNQPVI